MMQELTTVLSSAISCNCMSTVYIPNSQFTLSRMALRVRMRSVSNHLHVCPAMATRLSGQASIVAPSSLPAAGESAVARYLELYGVDDLTECPTSESEIQALLSKHDLKHGDVVNFGDYRDSDSHIVFRQKDGTLTLLANPDDRGAGYLTIPKVDL